MIQPFRVNFHTNSGSFFQGISVYIIRKMGQMQQIVTSKTTAMAVKKSRGTDKAKCCLQTRDRSCNMKEHKR